MNFSKLKDLLENEELGLNKLSKEDRKQVLKDTFLWLPGFKSRIIKKVDKILINTQKEPRF